MGSAEGAKKARKVREKNVKLKIQGAINVLNLYGEKITVRAVAKQAEVSSTTASKYLKTFYSLSSAIIA